MNKEKVFESIEVLKDDLNSVEHKLRSLRSGYFKAQNYSNTVRLAKLITLINVLQEALEYFYEEDFSDLEEIIV